MTDIDPIFEAEYQKRQFTLDFLPPRPVVYWTLRTGRGDFNRLPVDIRRIIYRMCRVWFKKAIPINQWINDPDKKLQSYMVKRVYGPPRYRDE